MRCVDDVDASASIVPAPRDLRSASGAFGTISFRHAAFGASVPWYLSSCRPGAGTSAANRARKSSGSMTTAVVPSLQA